MRNKTKLLLLFLMAFLIYFFLTIEAIAQNKEDSSPSLEDRTIFGFSYRYQNLPLSWKINFVGVFFEHYLTSNISVAGPIYWGKASDGRSYFHFPIGGLMIAILGGTIFNDIFEDGLPFNLGMIKYLFTENIHLLVSNKNNFTISPYLSLMGFDVSQAYGQNRDQTAMLGNGFGINFKTLLTDKLVAGSALELKHFIVTKPNQPNQNKISYNLSLYLGLLF